MRNSLELMEEWVRLRKGALGLYMYSISCTPKHMQLQQISYQWTHTNELQPPWAVISILDLIINSDLQKQNLQQIIQKSNKVYLLQRLKYLMINN